MISERSKVVVVGGGISGILSSYLISQNHDVTLIEKESQIGGHTNTFTIESGVDQGISVDTGFIVLNDRTYPTLHTFFNGLGVQVRDSDMSFGLYCENTKLQYAAPKLSSLFADRKNILSKDHWSMLFELAKFNKIGRASLADNTVSDKQSLKEYLVEYNISDYFTQNYLIPMAAAIWSSPDDGILDFPIKIFLRFFYNHGLLHLFDRPKWQTVVGGSHSYLKEFTQKFTGQIVSGFGVSCIKRENQHSVIILDNDDTIEADYVVIATHADQVLQLLDAPSAEEKSIFTSWEYQKNKTFLHTDETFLPPNKNARASWNYRREKNADSKAPLSVTYDMNRLQGLNAQHQYLVTLNGSRRPKEELIHYEIDYMHPVFSSDSVATQELLSDIQGANNTYFCGSYFGFGFHEDGALAGLKVGEAFGGSL